MPETLTLTIKTLWDKIKINNRNRVWIVILSITIILLGVLSYFLFFSDHKYSQLISFSLYMCIACSVIPLPTPPFVIGMGRIFPPLIVALTGAIGNCIGGLLDYYLVTLFFSKVQLLQKVQTSRIYRRGSVYFDRFAFPCLLFTGFSPIPFEPFRIMAIVAKYNLVKYLLAIFIGRMPRYYLVAYLGEEYQEYFTNKVLFLFLIALILMYLIQRIIRMYRRSKVSNREIP